MRWKLRENKCIFFRLDIILMAGGVLRPNAVLEG